MDSTLYLTLAVLALLFGLVTARSRRRERRDLHLTRQAVERLRAREDDRA